MGHADALADSGLRAVVGAGVPSKTPIRARTGSRCAGGPADAHDAPVRGVAGGRRSDGGQVACIGSSPGCVSASPQIVTHTAP